MSTQSGDLPPTPKQLRYLRGLTEQRGASFSPPRTRAQASARIEELKRRPRESSSDRRRDREAVSEGLANFGGATRVRDWEISGYGSSAHWR